jgi:transcriptional regulator with XRE-family HTH domain
MHIDRTVTTMDLADFLAEKLSKSSYRDMEDLIKVSRGSLENIIKRQNSKLPKIETLERIARTYDKELWEVMLMAGVNLGLPKDDTERVKRLSQLVARKPALEKVVEGLSERIDTDPDYVDGMILALEAGLNQKNRPLP